MPSPKRQNVRMRRVSMELRRLRKQAGLSGRVLARRLSVSPSVISRIENYGSGLSHDMLLEVLVALGAERKLRSALLRLHASADQPGLLDRGELQVNEDAAAWAGFEFDASVVRNYEPM